MRRLNARCVRATFLPAAGSIGAAITLVLAGLFSPTLPAGETWDGGGKDDNWTTGANWNTGPGLLQIPPPNNGTANIHIAGNQGTLPNVDVPYSINSLTFDSGSVSFFVVGQELTIGTGGIRNNDNSNQFVSAPVKLAADQTWYATGALLQMNAVNLNGFQLGLDGAFPIGLPGAITGVGGLLVFGTSTSTITMSGPASNTYTGDTYLAAGTLVLQKSGGAIAVPDQLFVTSDATVRLGADEQISHVAGNLVRVQDGVLDLEGHMETIAVLQVWNGAGVMTDVGGSLVVTESLEVNSGAFINGGLSLGDVATTVSSSGQVFATSDLIIGDAAGGTLDIISGGDVRNVNGYIGNQPGSSGAAMVHGSGSSWTNVGFLGIGEDGMGELEVLAGGRVSNTHATVGQRGTATALVSGTGSTWANSSFLEVGNNGTGALTIEDGGLVTNTDGFIGGLSGSEGTVTVRGTNSTWSNSGDLYVGNFGDGTLDISGGAHVINAHGFIADRATSTSSVTVDGVGSIWRNTGSLRVGGAGRGTLEISGGGKVENALAFIGANPGASGVVTVDGANSTWNTSTSLTLGFPGVDSGADSLSVINGGIVTVGGPTFVYSSSEINVSGGTFDGVGDLMVNGGSLMADAGAIVDVTQAYLLSGATIAVENESEFTQTAGSLFMESGTVMRVNSGATYNTDSTVVGNGPGPAAELIVDGADTLVKSISCCIDVGYGGTGIMTVTGGARVETGTGAIGSFEFGTTPSVGTLILDGTDASGNPSSWITQFGPNVGLSPTGQGMISIVNGALLRSVNGFTLGQSGHGEILVTGKDATGDSSLLDAGGLVIAGTASATGELTATDGGRIQVGVLWMARNGGAATLTVTGQDSSLAQSGASTMIIGHATDGMAVLNVTNGARLTSGTGAIEVNGTGEINLDSGAVFDARGPININGGQFNFLAGTLHVDNFNGNLLNQGGTLAPGHSIGATAISGNYTQRPAAALEIEIENVFPGDWDMLAIEGNASLDGAIEVVLLDDFEPVLGNSFTIITTNVGNVGGQFDTELFPIFNGLTFDVIYNAKSVVLQVIEATALPGDHNFDGAVDAADYVSWRKFDGSQEGYDLWRTNFGRPAGSGSGAAPEPTSLPMFILGVLAIFSRSRAIYQIGS